MDETMQILSSRGLFHVEKRHIKGEDIVLSHLNFMMMHGKIAGKLEAIYNLIFHHHSSAASSRGSHHSHLFFPDKINGHDQSSFGNKRNLKATTPTPPPIDSDEKTDMNAADSPPLPGFGPSPLVRQLRITDSPYPVRDFEEDNHVDEAADEFINKFYKDLKRQDARAYFGH